MHTLCYFELSLTLDTEDFQTLFDRVFEEPQGYESHSEDSKYIDDALASKGITISYYDNAYKKKIKLKIDPNEFLDEEPDDNNIAKMLKKIETHLNKYFDSQYGLDDFNLTKMGIITHIDFLKRQKATDYFRVIKKVGRVKGFSPPNSSRLDDDIGFYLKGNSNGIEVSIFNLEKLLKNKTDESEYDAIDLQSLQKKAEGVLRAEVWLASKAIQCFTDEYSASNQMAALLKNKTDIFLKILARIIPYGDFYKKKEAIEIIQKKVMDRKLRLRMIHLLTLIPEKKSLLLAQKAMNYRKIEEVMYAFYKIGLSPVTLSKRHEVKHLENLYDFLEN